VRVSFYGLFLRAHRSEKGKLKENCLACVFCIAALPFLAAQNTEKSTFFLIGKVVFISTHRSSDNAAHSCVCKFCNVISLCKFDWLYENWIIQLSRSGVFIACLA